MHDAPRELCGGVILMHFPPAPFVPPHLHGRPAVTVAAAWFGDLDDGEKALLPLKHFEDAAVDLMQAMPYVDFQAITDAGNPPGRRNYWQSDLLPDLTDEAIDTLIASAATAPSPFSVVIMGASGGAITDVPAEATPLTGRSEPWLYHCYANWTDPAADAANRAWARATDDAMRSWTTSGMALNFVSDVDQSRVESAFGAEKYRRLVALKDRYDPDNVFHLNQNVRPSGHSV